MVSIMGACEDCATVVGWNAALEFPKKTTFPSTFSTSFLAANELAHPVDQVLRSEKDGTKLVVLVFVVVAAVATLPVGEVAKLAVCCAAKLAVCSAAKLVVWCVAK